jgi:hypothetical protein
MDLLTARVGVQFSPPPISSVVCDMSSSGFLLMLHYKPPVGVVNPLVLLTTIAGGLSHPPRQIFLGFFFKFMGCLVEMVWIQHISMMWFVVFQICI